MRKVILVFEADNFSEGAFEFARKLHELEPLLLVGIFLPLAEVENLWSYANNIGPLAIPLVEEEEAVAIHKNIERFEELCKANGIEYRVHKDFFNLVLPELKKESLYADMVILGSEIFYEDMGANTASDYLEDALHNVVCPVLLVPEKFNFPESVILAYDGTEGSIFAIKQFTYLFPELTGRQTLLVYADDDMEKDIPQKNEIKELAQSHFKNISFFKLNIDAKKYFSTWVLEKKSAILISGSYGRSGISLFFKKSFVKDVVAAHSLPVFIAHK